jgi:hypothetical protein
MIRRRPGAVLLILTTLVGGLTAARATFPFRPGSDPYDYRALHIDNGACTGPEAATADLPSNFDCVNDFKLTDYAAQPGDEDYDSAVTPNPQELFGVKGSSTNLAWEITTGRPDTIIAVTDSGIRWDEDRSNLVNKFWLNRGELPVPFGAAKGGSLQAYDLNHDGVVNVKDYAGDPRAVDHGDDENEFLDPSDLIREFSDGTDDDGNGYVDDISGWDFFEDDNDPNDDVNYGHGTGESEDSAGETETNLDPQCPNCMLMEMRVGDSFVADVNHFAEAAYYATDNGASVIQSALGTLNHTKFAQDAADYAYDHGVLFMASEADESAGHHNFPSALNHTLLANSVTHFADVEGLPVQIPKTYLAFNGCTNFGGYSWITVASTSCSSDAIGQSSGMAGLLYSAARNAVEDGVIEPDRSGKPISAEEAKQLFRAAADDVDFSTPQVCEPPFTPPCGAPNNFTTTLPASQRFVTTEGWDQISGWGRINANRLVRLVADGLIPPEADVTAPRWWQPLATTGTVDVVGRVAAPRAGSFEWEVRFAPGVQPPRFPLTDAWTTVATGTGDQPVEGVLAQLDLGVVRAAIDAAPPAYLPTDDPTSPELPEKDAFRVQVVVVDDNPDTPDAVEQRPYFSVDQAGLLPGFPTFLAGDGAGAPAFDDLDGDGGDELIIGDGNGLVHAFKADGREAAGWPVKTSTIALPDRLEFKDRHAAVLLGSPAVADLDGDGWAEVSVADTSGFLHVWNHDGAARQGFPVRNEPAFSEEPGCHVSGSPRPACDDYRAADVRDDINTVYRSFTAMPSVGDLDKTTPGLELVAGSNDGHVYAWHADGAAVEGWPVLLRDPSKVAAVDPVSHKVSFVEGANERFGRKVITTPTLGDVDGDGDLEVLSNVNEEYEETPNFSDFSNGDLEPVALVNPPGNTRVYLLHHDGTAHPASAEQQATAHPDDQAYVAGWPASIAMLTLELLPYVGEGSNASAVIADVDGDGDGEIGTASIAGPAYLLNGDGTSFLGDGPDDRANALATTPKPGDVSDATDYPSVASLGGGVFGRMGGAGSDVVFAMGASGLRRLLDVVLPEQQLLAEDHINVWESDGSFATGFPAQMHDLMFFNTPALADVTGDGEAEVLQSSAMYDLQAYDSLGQAADGFPKFTGGWSVMTPSVGDLDGDGVLDLALATREGNLFVWETAGEACQTVEWPKYQHDLRNTGDYRTDARRPGVVTGLRLDGDTASFTTSGGDGRCGQATSFRVTVNGAVVNVDVQPAAAGTAQSFRVPGVGPGATVTVQTVDAAGNVSAPATVRVAGTVVERTAPAAAPILPATGSSNEAMDIGLVLLALCLGLRLGRRSRKGVPA